MRDNMGKYRGKRVDNGEWVFGFLIKGFRTYILPVYAIEHMIVSILHHASVELVEVIPETVGECSGVLDKFCFEVYEGDIIKTHYANVPKADFIETVVFRYGGFKSEYNLDDGGKMWAPLADGIKHIHQDKSMYMESFEKLGNIHDHPELLEELK